MFFHLKLSVVKTSEMMHLYMILCGAFYLSAVIKSAAINQDSGVISTSVGDNVTLHCFYDSQVAMHFSWYRQPLGGGPELLSTLYKYNKPSKVLHWIEKAPRFFVQREDGVNHLHITDVQLSDSATYYCGSSHANIVEFGDGVFLSVKGASQPKEIVQSPVSEIIQPGGSVTLNCMVHTGTCDGETSVYWFRQGSRQGILHTPGDLWTRGSTPGSSSQSCVYHLQKINLNSSDAGVYYCAVASCGEILFGDGSKLLNKGDFTEQMMHMRILVWLSIIRTGIILFVVTVCLLVYVRKNK